MKRALTILALVLVAAAIPAQCQWREGDTEVEDTQWRKTEGDFGAMLQLSAEPDDFLAQWDQPTSPGYIPNIKTTSKVKRGDLIVGFILFTGCAAGKDGNCSAVTDFVLVGPDGSEYAREDRAPLWSDAAPPAHRHLQLGTAYLGVIVEPQDLLGEYTMTTKVCDQVAEVCIDLSRTFEVTHILAGFDLDTLMDSYYLDPRPEFISRAIGEIGDRKLFEDPNVVPPIIAFFSEVFSRNKDRSSEWKRLIGEQEEKTRILLLAAFEASTDPEVVRGRSSPSPSQNDIFWAAYFASGDIKYLDAIFENLIFDSEREEINLYLTGASAKWSLSSNLRRHIRVKQHVERRLNDSDETTASLLQEVTQKSPAELRAEMITILQTQHEAGVW